MKKLHVLIFCVILLIAAALRLYKLGTIPISMYIDEIAIGVDAKSIAQTGRDMHGHSWLTPMFLSYGDYKLPVYIWMAAASVKIFGATEFAVRLPSAVAGVLTVFLIYFISVELFEKRKDRVWIGLASAAVTAVLPWSVLFSRTGFEGHVGQMFLLLSILFALYARKRPLFMAWSAIVGALAVYTYFSVRFVFPVVLLASFIVSAKKFESKYIFRGVLGLVVFFLLLVPLVRSPYYAPSNAFRLSASSILDNTQRVVYSNVLRAQDHEAWYSRIFHHRELYFLKDLITHYAAHFDLSYLFISGDVNLRHSTGKTGVMLITFAPLFFAGLYVCARKEQKIGIFLAVWYLIALLPASVPNEVPHALRSINGLSVVALLCGLGTVELYAFFNKKHFGKIILGILVLAILSNIFVFLHDYTAHYPTRSADAWSYGKRQIAQFIEKEKTSRDHIIVAVDDSIYLWVLFYGNYDFTAVQRMPFTDNRLKRIDTIEFRGLAAGDGALKKTLIIGLSDEMHQDVGFYPIPTINSQRYVYRSQP
ncbi:MAG: hypothetical protein A2840_02500 [Candidatus Buchananbacteria bacterium RIFCSPHIGHO2_01_FULL_47_11b]|uniref:Glycosyltransferase RgtA/B/C/D-like domain-containing protein n=1 Tax=Candidatus Buchananbacteria bacterium RIFCSPHIGHO2_01_FULL_47_11b TaxID=1797537 RepID=A0A1G1Y2Y6_9BACT|nr:MAG: hypothetical protein A2840_02500 [Candidatus Buchananbacteria bacterium RIFCSPHIGHO2_01_FULL_47_11b]